MNYLQKQYKGRKLIGLLNFISDLEIDGGFIPHIFVLHSQSNKPLYYFQLYNQTTGALILVKTHRITNQYNRYLDLEIKEFFSPDKFIVDKVMLKTITDITDATNIENFFRHIENLLLQ